MDDLLYFTNRTMDDGRIKAWVYKKMCPECGKALMGKPVAKGKVKIRASTYECPECGYQEPKKSHEESLRLEIQYTCPFCQHSGEASTEYKRKTWQGVKAYVFECESCENRIGVTKKMKQPKKKKK